MKRLLNRMIKHERDDEGDFGYRMAVHIPVGLLASLPVLGGGLLRLFLEYERNEDLHTQDEAWKDIFGAIVGYVIGTLMVLAGLIWLVVKYAL
jgi:prolipoprotein diacylglyceryltransferase